MNPVRTFVSRIGPPKSTTTTTTPKMAKMKSIAATTTRPPPPVPPNKAAAAKRGAKGICASGVCTTKGVIPLAQYLASAAAASSAKTPAATGRARLPVLSSKVGMTTPMPVPMGGVFDTVYKPADLNGPCDMCALIRVVPPPLPPPLLPLMEGGGEEQEQEELQQPEAPPPYHVLRVTGRGCLPVGHGVYCSAECAQTAVFRHPAYRHWDDTDRFVSYQTMQRNPRPPIAYSCALFQDSIYQAGRRTTTEVPQCRYRVQRASEQQAVARKDARQELLADFFKFTPEKVAALLG